MNRLRDRDEQEVDADGHRDDHVDPAAVSFGVERAADPDARERDTEEPRVDARGEVEVEVNLVVRRPAVEVEEHAHGELADEPETVRAQHQPAAQLDVELTLRVDPAGDAHAGETEEVGGRAERDHPLARVEVERVALRA